VVDETNGQERVESIGPSLRRHKEVGAGDRAFHLRARQYLPRLVAAGF
jgi:hypothetical protein